MIERTYKYFMQTNCYFGEHEIIDEGYDFSYTPSPRDLSDAIVEVVTDYFFEEEIKANPSKVADYEKQVKDLIDAEDYEEVLADAFEEELKGYFEAEAMESERCD